ncbi:MAG TPA: YhcN/YlaJ family sporulation lipoprotein [Bacillota bacterium]|nr:YhcN/YlaJ family sporulation lipoprotein [Bacillota bacterium]
MKRLFISFTMLLPILGITACGSTHIQDRGYQDVKKFDARGPFQIQDTGPTYKTNPSSIEGRLASIPGVGKASVVSYGDSIFIGFRRDSHYGGTDQTLKRKIFRALQTDAKHNQLYIVANDSLVSRIENISQRINTGQEVPRIELQKLMNDVGLKVRPLNLIEKT